jgi:hypothetical protein
MPTLQEPIHSGLSCLRSPVCPILAVGVVRD